MCQTIAIDRSSSWPSRLRISLSLRDALPLLLKRATPLPPVSSFRCKTAAVADERASVSRNSCSFFFFFSSPRTTRIDTGHISARGGVANAFSINRGIEPPRSELRFRRFQLKHFYRGRLPFGRPRARLQGIKCPWSDFAPGKASSGRPSGIEASFHPHFRGYRPPAPTNVFSIAILPRASRAIFARKWPRLLSTAPSQRAALIHYREPRDTRISRETQSSQFTAPAFFSFFLSFFFTTIRDSRGNKFAFRFVSSRIFESSSFDFRSNGCPFLR